MRNAEPLWKEVEKLRLVCLDQQDKVFEMWLLFILESEREKKLQKCKANINWEQRVEDSDRYV